uniref:F5/8 type C domain-containing protein n=1 Tax=Ascaris lumbricoides TaxID=6252 RepID=A0A0M3HR33_ASCLU
MYAAGIDGNNTWTVAEYNEEKVTEFNGAISAGHNSAPSSSCSHSLQLQPPSWQVLPPASFSLYQRHAPSGYPA